MARDYLMLNPIYYEPNEEEKRGGGWYVVVYDLKEKAVFSTILFSRRADALEEAQAWCKSTYPGIEASLPKLPK